MPVPAGMRWPMMMFSLSPSRSSLAPRMAASVSTRVVSWNDAAEMNDCVVSDALEPVDLLDLVQQVFLHRPWAFDLQNVVRVHRPFGQPVSRPHLVTFVNP